MKKAFIIVGPESSGTRMLTRLFVESGSCGSDQHDQLFDHVFPSSEDNIVWRRSIPHGGIKEPNVEEMYKHLVDKGYSVILIIINRDIICTVNSQINNNHVSTEIDSIKNIQDSFVFIFDLIKKLNIKYFLINYESLILHKTWTIQNLSKLINFELIDFDIKNENIKWIN